MTVDMVGGTSQGAFCGALFARYPDDFNNQELLLQDVVGNYYEINLSVEVADIQCDIMSSNPKV